MEDRRARGGDRDETLFTITALGSQVIFRVSGKTGSTLKVPKMVEEGLRVEGCDVRNHFELSGT